MRHVHLQSGHSYPVTCQRVTSCIARLFGIPLLWFCLLSSTTQHAFASDEDWHCSESDPECVPIGEWMITVGVGIGMRTNPIVNGKDIPLFILPEIRYYGERFFIDTYTAGLTLAEFNQQMINVVGTIGFDQIYFKSRSIGNFVIESGAFSVSDDDPDQQSSGDPEIDFDRLHSRDTAGLAGLEYSYYNQYWDLSLQLLQDVTGVHEGQEIRAGLAHFFSIAGELFEVAGGFSWQSEKLLQYYYGVELSEVDSPLLAYQANDGVSPFFRLDWRRPIANRWSWQATLHYRWLSEEISGSPLVEENSVVTFHLGGVYHF